MSRVRLCGHAPDCYTRDMPKSLALSAILLLAAAMLPGCASPAASRPHGASAGSRHAPRVLLFTRTTGYRHASIPVGVQALRELARAEGIALIRSEDPALFDDASLARFDAVVFLSTTGDVLDETGQAADAALPEVDRRIILVADAAVVRQRRVGEAGDVGEGRGAAEQPLFALDVTVREMIV